jgi:hypothetical protein
MKRASRYARPFLAGLLLIGVLSVLCLVLFWILTLRQDRASIIYESPLVTIHEPGSSSIPTGSSVTISATVYFRADAPVERVDLWLDGRLTESQEQSPAEGDVVLFQQFDLPISSEGPHMLFVRAINKLGVTGQSELIDVFGTAKPKEAFYAILFKTGDSLTGIAETYGTDTATLEQVNPSLDGQPPAPGTLIKVPLPAEQEPPTPISQSAPEPGNTAVMIPNVPMLNAIGSDPFIIHALDLFVASPPAAPTGLQVEVKDCRVILTWNDNASNETGYKVWLATAGAPVHLVGDLQPAAGVPAWFEFPAPAAGSYNLWVEAVNGIGIQPSNLVDVTIDSQCPAGSATHLQVEIQDMTLPASYDRAYCYISFMNAPEVRLPAHDGDFIQVLAGHGDTSAWAQSLALPLPSSNVLGISGECWGWSGTNLDKLGVFSNKFPNETWDGHPQTIQAGTSQISVAIQPSIGVKQTYTDKSPGFPGPGGNGGWISDSPYQFDPSLTVPYDLQLERSGSPAGLEDPLDEYQWFWERRLIWKWSGDPNQITGFVIFLNGKLYATLLNPTAREMRVKLPGTCGRELNWQVAAVAGTAQSQLSLAVIENLPACKTYIKVQFQSIQFSCTADGMSDCLSGYAPQVGGSLCGTLDAKYQLSVNGVTMSFYGGNFFLPLKCGVYNFSELGEIYTANHIYPSADTFVIPVSTDSVDIKIQTRFWDYDSDSANDEFGFHSESYWFPSHDRAVSDLGLTGGDCKYYVTTGEGTTGTASSFLKFTIEVIPNVCRDSP